MAYNDSGTYGGPRRLWFWSLWRLIIDTLRWLYLPAARDLELHRVASAERSTDVLHLERDKPMREHVARIARHPNYFGSMGVIEPYAF